MRLMWSDPAPGECVHGEPVDTCPICHPHHSRLDDGGIVLLVLLVAAMLVFGRGSWERELAFDDAVQRAHDARVLRAAQP